MAIQHKQRFSLQDLLESQWGKDVPGKVAQSKPPTPPPPALPLQLEPARLKRKRELKGKEVMDTGKTHPSQRDEAQKVAKKIKMG